MSENIKKPLTVNGGSSSAQLKKVATGIHGLDSVLKGGLPAGRATLLCGGPGTGKSVLALEFLYRGALMGEPGIFVTFEERADMVRENAATLGWDLAALERSGKLFILEARLPREAVNAGDFNISGLLSIIAGKARQINAKRLALDALDVLLRIYRDPYREQDELYALHDWLGSLRVASIITAKMHEDNHSACHYEFLHYMADCVINLEQRIEDRITNRLLLVVKYRGSDFGSNENPFIIIDDGVKFTPLSSTSLDYRAQTGTVSIGHPGMDEILGGPIRRGSCILISGSPGTGKTTIACAFSKAACDRKERVLYISFEESADALIDCMLSPGIDLTPAIKSGRLKILSVMPESSGVNVHLYHILQAVEQFKPDHIVVDAISSSHRMGSEQTAFDFAIRLVSIFKELGITAFFTAQLEGLGGMSEISGINISSLADTVISLRYIDIGGEMNRMMLVVKARGRRHSNQYREFVITGEGFSIADVYAGEGGVLTGSARQEQEMKERISVSRRQRAIREKEAELAAKKAASKSSNLALETEILRSELDLEALKAEEDMHKEGRQTRSTLRGTDLGRAGRKPKTSPLPKEEKKP
ncbi:MAG: circadian clock protein KaiC [Deltaproteobacteria bacterium]|nr:circadian clock protein KaiC [Deltaproteobacteria bacterium]